MVLLTDEGAVNALFSEIYTVTEETVSNPSGPLSWDAILVIIILMLTLYGVMMGAVRMIAPILSFLVARALTPVVCEKLQGHFLERIVNMYTEAYLKEYPNGFPFATELLDVVSRRMLELIAFVITLAIIRVLFGFMFYFVKSSMFTSVPNSAIGGMIGFCFAILLISVSVRIAAFASPMSPSAAKYYNGVSSTPIGGCVNGVADILFKEIKTGIENAEPMMNQIEESVRSGAVEEKATDFVNGVILNDNEIPEDLND